MPRKITSYKTKFIVYASGAVDQAEQKLEAYLNEMSKEEWTIHSISTMATLIVVCLKKTMEIPDAKA